MISNPETNSGTETFGWWQYAECRWWPTELFFPAQFPSQSAERAVRVCNRCPVIEECLASALEEEGNRESSLRHGVRGGLGPIQRKAMAVAHRKYNEPS